MAVVVADVSPTGRPKGEEAPMSRPDDLERSGEERTHDGALSRRQLLAASLAVAGAGLAPAHAAAAPPETEARSRLVGVTAAGTTAVEFRARFSQTGLTGEHFAAYGYLTNVAGLTEDDLFAGSPPSEATALLTAYAVGELVRRTVDQSVHSLDIEGTLTIYHRPAAGASFDDQDSFQVGTPVARFALTLQDIVTVFTTGKGLPTLTGDMRQTFADRLDGAGQSRRFGHVGARARLFATGIGTLLDPVTSNSILEMAGNWTIG
jgi:hypothetical protein